MGIAPILRLIFNRNGNHYTQMMMRKQKGILGLLGLGAAVLLLGCVGRYKAPADHLTAQTSQLNFTLLTESLHGTVFVYVLDEGGGRDMAGTMTNGNLLMRTSDNLSFIVEAGQSLTFEVVAMGSAFERSSKATYTLIPQAGFTYSFAITYELGALKKAKDTPDPGKLSIISRGATAPAGVSSLPAPTGTARKSASASSASASTDMAAYYRKELAREDLDPAIRDYYQRKLDEAAVEANP